MKSKNFSLLASKLIELKHRIKVSCDKNSVKDSSIKILAVSKKKSVNDIKTAISIGLKNFGENFTLKLVKLMFF